ncbi:MAG: hypothetical protein JO352_25685 [Chloroflexi bacterium]|nr:hypothetical protein [Chloroflexota bacterium]MBV9597018.1 hypothetical protein [Chloroflexota bacterium]
MRQRVRLVTVGGLLGAGKTTTMLKTLDILRLRGITAAYIANDQGEGLVDTAYAQASGAPVAEVLRGCFCCRFDELVETITRLVDEQQPDLILAEAVGSCADLVSTVIRPLRRFYGDRFELAPYSVVVDPRRYQSLRDALNPISGTPLEQVAYLFRKQIEEGQVVALNKVDLLANAERVTVLRGLAALAPTAHLIPYSAQTAENLEALVEVWLGESASDTQPALEIDYDLYAEAEAQLAWVNLAGRVESLGDTGFRPSDWTDEWLSVISRGVCATGALVGHIKLHMMTPAGHTKASLVNTDDRPIFASRQRTVVDRGELLVNARVAVDPQLMREMIVNAVQVADSACGTLTSMEHMEAFRPARPQPVHRILAAT